MTAIKHTPGPLSRMQSMCGGIRDADGYIGNFKTDELADEVVMRFNHHDKLVALLEQCYRSKFGDFRVNAPGHGTAGHWREVFDTLQALAQCKREKVDEPAKSPWINVECSHCHHNFPMNTMTTTKLGWACEDCVGQ